MRVARLVLDQIPQNLRTLGWMAAWSALASTTIMGLVDAAAEQAAKETTAGTLLRRAGLCSLEITDARFELLDALGRGCQRLLTDKHGLDQHVG